MLPAYRVYTKMTSDDGDRRAEMSYRFLRHERDMFPVLRDVELRDGLPIEVDGAGQRVVEPLDQLNAEKIRRW